MQESMKRKLLAGGIAGALVLGVGAVAGAAVGTGSLDDNGSQVRHRDTTEVEHGTEVETSTTLGTTPPTVETTDPTLSDDGIGHDVGDDHGVDGIGHDVGDDHGVDGPGHDVGDDHGGSVNSGPGSVNSGPGSDDSGRGGDSSGHGGGDD